MDGQKYAYSADDIRFMVAEAARAGVPGPLGVDFMVCSYTTAKNLAGRTGLEPATDGFGDRNSTN